MSPAQEARLMAERIRTVGQEVLASFASDDAAQRVAGLRHVEAQVLAGTSSVVGWIERHRTATEAAVVVRRIEWLLHEAIGCAGMTTPEYRGGAVARVTGQPSAGAFRTATLVASASETAKSLLGWADVIDAEALPQAAEDDAAFRPAKEFTEEGRFFNVKVVRAVLKKHPWIRTRKPSKYRLLVHAGDWLRLLAAINKSGFDALDQPTAVADIVAGMQERQQRIREKKAGR